MQGPALSVAMSVYNNAPYVAAAIESILDQTFTDFEFLIVNDGSTDGSGAIIDGYAARDPRIRAIHQDNCGFIASLNRIIAEARAPLIARMDGDDICLPERFALQMAFLENHPGYGVIGSLADAIDTDGNPLVSDDPKPLTHEGLIANLPDGPLMNHNVVLIRRDVLERVGGYRPFYRHCEDYDLWLRVSQVTRMANLPERLILYRHYPDQVSHRHLVGQVTRAAIAWAAHEERLAGRPDPTEDWTEMPAIGDLDRLFNRAGVSRAVRAAAIPRYLYDVDALAGDGYRILIDHVRDTNPIDRSPFWRAVLRLAKGGRPGKALGLATALAAH
jgi:glycosyltransferase involved in cell wall biosynthesis